MFRVFNSIQFVGLFAGMPYLISWLYTNPFPYASTAAFWTAIVGYVVMFFLNVAAVVEATEKL